MAKIKIHSADHIAEVLREIQSRIPKNLLKNAVKQVKLTPTVEFVVDKMLEKQDLPSEKRDQIQALKDAGQFCKMKYIDNPKIQEMINNFVSREINKAIREGRLPPQKEIKDVDFIKSMYKKMEIK